MDDVAAMRHTAYRNLCAAAVRLCRVSSGGGTHRSYDAAATASTYEYKHIYCRLYRTSDTRFRGDVTPAKGGNFMQLAALQMGLRL